MPLAPQQFQILSPEQANPFATGFKQGADIGNVFSQTLMNQLHGQLLKAQAQQAQAQSGYLGSETAINQTKNKNPELYLASGQVPEQKYAGYNQGYATNGSQGVNNGQQNSGNASGGAGGTNLPTSDPLGQNKAVNIASQTQAITNQNEAIAEENKNAQVANKALIDLNGGDAAYKHIDYWKGQRAGRMPTWAIPGQATNETDADTGFSNVQKDLAGLGGKYSNMKLLFEGQTKPSRAMGEGAEDSLAQQNRAYLQRALQIPAARQFAQNAGLNWQQQNIALAKWQQENTPFDYDKRKVIPDAVSNESFAKWLTSKKLKQIQSGALDEQQQTTGNVTQVQEPGTAPLQTALQPAGGANAPEGTTRTLKSGKKAVVKNGQWMPA